jgi:hypothetical protein
MRRIGRLCLAAGAVAGTWLVPALVSPASAASVHPKPTITTSEASFVIPKGAAQAWLIRLWTLPTPSTLEGQTFGTSGTISVKVPATTSCDFQVDVLSAPPGTTKPADFKWYSGTTAIVTGCGAPHCGSTTSIGVDGASGTHVKPTINNVEATFTIPSGPKQAWVIRLWTLPTPSTLEGQAFGSSGTLTLDVPLTSNCDFQVDVKVAPAGTTNPNDFTWYSGITAKV